MTQTGWIGPIGPPRKIGKNRAIFGCFRPTQKMCPEGPKWGREVFFRLKIILPTFWAERTLLKPWSKICLSSATSIYNRSFCHWVVSQGSTSSAHNNRGAAYFLKYVSPIYCLSNLICESIHDHNITTYPILGYIWSPEWLPMRWGYASASFLNASGTKRRYGRANKFKWKLPISGALLPTTPDKNIQTGSNAVK